MAARTRAAILEGADELAQPGAVHADRSDRLWRRLNWYNYVGSDPVNGTDPSGTVEHPGGPPNDAQTIHDIVVLRNIMTVESGGGGGIDLSSATPYCLPGPGCYVDMASSDIVVTATSPKPKSLLPGVAPLNVLRICPYSPSIAGNIARWADSISATAGTVAIASAGLGLATAPTGAGFAGFETVAAGAATVSTAASVVGGFANAFDGNWEKAAWDFAGLAGGAVIGRLAKSLYRSTRVFGDLSASQERSAKFLGYGAGNAVGSTGALLGCQ